MQVHLLVREMDFRALEIRSLIATAAGAAAAIGVAAYGGGAWALIVQPLVYFSVSLVLLWRFSPWRPQMVFSRASLREMRGFGGNVSGTMMMAQLTQNTDNVLIGKFLGASALGLYGFGVQPDHAPPHSRRRAAAGSPLPRVLTVRNDLQRLSSQWLRAIRLMAVVMMPAMLGLIVVAPDMVTVVFGVRWQGATTVIQILSIVGLASGLQGLNAMALQSLDRTRLLLTYSCVLFAAALVAFVVGLQWGIVGVAGCFAAVNVLIQPAFLHVTARAMGIGLRQCAQALSGVVQATAWAIAGAVLTRWLLSGNGVPAAARLAATIVVAATIYVPALIWRAPQAAAEIRELRPRRPATASGTVAVATSTSTGVTR